MENMKTIYILKYLKMYYFKGRVVTFMKKIIYTYEGICRFVTYKGKHIT